MAEFSETVDIKRPPEDVWRVLGKSEDPKSDTRNDHLYRTRMTEEVEVRVTAPRRRLCSRRLGKGKTFGLIVFKGLGKLAAPIASRDFRNRRATSLERLKAAVEAGE